MHKNKNILKNCLEICKINSCKTIIYFSSAAVYSQNNTKKKITEKFTISESNIYSRFKIYAESRIHSYAKENKKKAIILRLFNIFNNSNFSDCHTGYWVYDLKKIKKEWLKEFDNGFLFDLDMRKKIIKQDYLINETPIPTRYGNERSSIHLGYAIKFFLKSIFD